MHTNLRGIIVVLIIPICAFQLNAQVNIDSLRNAASDRSNPDSVRYKANFDLIWEGYLFSEPDTAFILAKELQRDARSTTNVLFEARASELLAATWYVRGDLRTALAHYDTALTLHTRNGDENGMADVITNMAGMRSFLGERDEALNMYSKGLRIHEALKDSLGVANDLNAMGTVHMALGNHAEAVELMARSLRIQEQLQNDRGIATSHANLGTLFNEQGDHQQALAHYEKALRIAEKLDDRHMMGKDLEEIGSCLDALGDTARAMESLVRSLAIRSELEDHHGIVNVRFRIGDLLAQQGKNAEALVLYDQCIAMAKELELPWGLGNALLGKAKVLFATGQFKSALNIANEAERAAVEAEEVTLQRDVVELRYEVLRALGQWREALAAYEQSVLLNDSIMREENQRAVLRNEYRYAYQNEAYKDSIEHIVTVEKERIEHLEEVTKERSIRNSALMLGGILVAFLFAIWQRAKILKRTNAAILDAQEQLVESEKQREASDVRTRIARDVHDQLGSDLTKLVMLSGEIKANAAHNADLAGHADDIELVASEANRSLGDIVWAIDPHHDSLKGLTERVRAHCERMLKWSRTTHTVNCVHEGEDRSLDPATKRDIYLMVRETLNNAVKYSKAHYIHVTFLTDNGQVRFEIKDDGVGLVESNGNTGNGLANLRRRAERIGADLSIDGSEGTCITLHLALTD